MWLQVSLAFLGHVAASPVDVTVAAASAVVVVAVAAAASAVVAAVVADSPFFAKAASFRFVGLQLVSDVESSTSRRKRPCCPRRKLCSEVSVSSLEKNLNENKIKKPGSFLDNQTPEDIQPLQVKLKVKPFCHFETRHSL